jgi:hypothetical protein
MRRKPAAPAGGSESESLGRSGRPVQDDQVRPGHTSSPAPRREAERGDFLGAEFDEVRARERETADRLRSIARFGDEA